ncbi:putative oxidoreductase [Lasiosphaeria hispida]|uniref:Oxidoreductase n=1 Tax=Lasiosphaeria hispida TaxID=260671 RepID=A0AAJ0MGU4_9PEZI|nr:putative oxidoreductase [Lasiosphaeria hispida]
MDQVVVASNQTEAQSLTGACCLALLSLFSDKVFFPGSQGYNASQSSYFSQQHSQIAPLCVVSPTSPEDVSAVIVSLTSTASLLESDDEAPGCRFAIRSGGHSSIPGAANIADGVTIDLRTLNEIELSDDKSIVSIGPGARWGDVYTKLEIDGLSVAGGRVSQVGVGGLVVGGGISFFSPRYGFTCDSATNFEVVLADGSIVNANENENKDLLVALRGGSGNFGIVTRVDMRTFEQGEMLGGNTFHDLSAIEDHIEAFIEFNSADAYDEYAALIMSFGFAPGRGQFVVNNMVYSKPEERPPVYEKLANIPFLQSSMRLDKMSGLAAEMGAFSPNGMRQKWLQLTFKSTAVMLNSVFDHWKASLPVVENVAGLIWSLSLHPLPPNTYKNPLSTGNSLGLSDRSGALVVALLTVAYLDVADDDIVEETSRKLMDAVEKDARESRAYDPFKYFNYAGPGQDPVGSYGSESLEHLQAVRQRVDPNGVFAHQVPGGHKLAL